MPIPAASRSPARCSTAYELRLSHRSDLRLRRHHRLQPPARRRDRGGRSSSASSSKCSWRLDLLPGAAAVLATKRERPRAGHRRRSPPAPAPNANCAASAAACWCRTAIAAASRPRTCACVTKRQPTPRSCATCCSPGASRKFVKSNAIVFARDGATIGVGAGQMSRVYSSRIAAIKAEDAELDGALAP